MITGTYISWNHSNATGLQLPEATTEKAVLVLMKSSIPFPTLKLETPHYCSLLSRHPEVPQGLKPKSPTPQILITHLFNVICLWVPSCIFTFRKQGQAHPNPLPCIYVPNQTSLNDSESVRFFHIYAAHKYSGRGEANFFSDFRMSSRRNQLFVGCTTLS